MSLGLTLLWVKSFCLISSLQVAHKRHNFGDQIHFPICSNLQIYQKIQIISNNFHSNVSWNPFWQLDVAHWVSAGLKLNELMDCIKLATLVNYKFSLPNFNSVNWIDINIFLDYFDLLYLQLNFDIILKLEHLYLLSLSNKII